jgi:dTDP-4-dehydrorhamnose 3,5-epimerase
MESRVERKPAAPPPLEAKPVKVRSHHLIHRDVGSAKGQIEGAWIKDLALWPDDRGHFAEIFRDDEKVVANFQVKQSSVTVTRPGVIKAFHFHLEQDDVFVPLKGTIRIALVDCRVASPTYGVANSIFAGELYPKAVRIPRGVAHGYEVLPGGDLLMVYYTDKHYDPKDEYRFRHDDPAIGFTWWGIENR